MKEKMIYPDMRNSAGELKYREQPDGLTPWPAINQLLAPIERFAVQFSCWQGFLLAPSQSSQLAALLFQLQQEKLSFCVQGRGTTCMPSSQHRLIVSARNFTQLSLKKEAGSIEVGAGCQLFDLQSFLFAHRLEMSLEAAPLSSLKRSVAGLMTSGQTADLFLQKCALPEVIKGVELVTYEGSQVQWGSVCQAPAAGPVLHHLLWNCQQLPIVIVKLMLKVHPIPPARLQLCWSFRQKHLLWEHVQELQQFSSSWERLDCLFSAQEEERAFVIAQVSGLPCEMQAFERLCPRFTEAQRGIEHVFSFLHQLKLQAYPASHQLCLKPGEYLLRHLLSKRAWLLTSQPFVKPMAPSSIWHERLVQSLDGEKNGR